MAENGADFTLTFRRLCAAAAGTEGDAAVRSLFADASAYDAWAVRWRERKSLRTPWIRIRAAPSCRR